MLVQLSKGRRGAPLCAKVADLAEASRLVRAYIEEHDLPSSRWSGGSVMDGGLVVARVSYNGRVWPPEPWRPGIEPLI